MFVKTLIVLLYYKFSKKYMIMYYPKNTDSLICNYLFILPQRMGFDVIYNGKKFGFFSWKNLFAIFWAIVVITIIGMPIILIKIIAYNVYFFKKKLAWTRLSPYNNYKIIIYNGKITRNMKHIPTIVGKNILSKEATASILKAQESYLTINENLGKNVKTGVSETGKGTHLIGFPALEKNPLKTTGVLVSSKKGKNFGEIIYARKMKKNITSHAYLQQFEENIKTYNTDNSNLIKFEKESLLPCILKANILIKNFPDNGKILMNVNSEQFVVAVTKADRDYATEFLNKVQYKELYKDAILLRHIFAKESDSLICKLANLRENERRNFLISHYDRFYKNLKLLIHNAPSDDALLKKLQKIQILTNQDITLGATPIGKYRSTSLITERSIFFKGLDDFSDLFK